MRHVIVGLLFFLLALPAFAGAVKEAMRGYAQDHLEIILGNPAVIDAIRRQNAQTADLTDTEIANLDRLWRHELSQGNSALIASRLTGPTAQLLTGVVSASAGAITELFIMDARGLNVAQSAPTSDYWQGDEDKYTQTYVIGPGAIHVSEVDYDESTGRYQSQISMTISDPDSGAPIGAITFGFDARAFF